MKTSAKILLLVTGLISSALPLAMAADPSATTPTPAPDVTAADQHHRLKALKQRRKLAAHALSRRLDLSRDQVTQLKTLRAKTASSLKDIRHDSTLTPEQKKARLREVRQGARAEGRGMLTAEQKAKAGKLRQHLRQRRDGNV